MPTTDQRLCDSCGQVDNHPRHTHGLGPDAPNPTSPEIARAALKAATDETWEDLYAQVEDGRTQVKHIDCCAADGCPDGSCDRLTALQVGVGEKKGDALRKSLEHDKVTAVGRRMNHERAVRDVKAREAAGEDVGDAWDALAEIDADIKKLESAE